jgi:hypothetical protein
MKKITNKYQLMDTMRASRRQLDRYLFFFEKDPSGEFTAGKRFKFSEEETNTPGVVGSWSLYQVLAQVRSSEEAFLNSRLSGIQGPGGFGIVGFDSMARTFGGLVGSPQAQPLPEFLEHYRASHQEILAYVNNLPEEMLFAPQPTALVDELVEATCRRYEWAKEQIRNWRKPQSSQQISKALILKRIQSERCRLEKTLEGLTPAQMTQPGVIGKWSVKDILAHLAAWEQLFIGWYQAGLRGETPPVPAPGFTWHEMGKLNESIFEQYHPTNPEDVQSWFASSYRQVLQLVEGIPENELLGQRRYNWQGRYSLLNYVLANTANHYRWANQKIRTFFK